MLRKCMLFGSVIIMSAVLFGCNCSGMKHLCKESYEPTYVQFGNMSSAERLKTAEEKRGLYYANRLDTFMKDEDYKKGGTVFIGDSITQRFPIKEAFEGKNVINRGIGGDRIMGVAERLDVCIKDLEPSKIYLMIGINDINWAFSSIEDLAKQYNILLKDLQYTAPKADITVFSVLPMTHKFAVKNNLVLELNEKIITLVKKYNMKYFDLYPFFADKNGELRESLTTEGLHLSKEGYLTWLYAILDKDEFYETAVNLSGLWMENKISVFEVTKIDPPSEGEYPGNRGANELIIYTPKYKKPTTGTNAWGTEAIVRNGIVEKVYKSNSPIPPDGYVVSGHGLAEQWILQGLKPGVLVEYDSKSISFTDSAGTEGTPGVQLKHLKKKLFEKLIKIKESGTDKQNEDLAKCILMKIQELEIADSLSMSDVDYLSQKLSDLKL